MAPKSDTSLFVLVPVLVFVFVWTYYTSSANHFPHPITTPLWRTLALHLNGGLSFLSIFSIDLINQPPPHPQPHYVPLPLPPPQLLILSLPTLRFLLSYSSSPTPTTTEQITTHHHGYCCCCCCFFLFSRRDHHRLHPTADPLQPAHRRASLSPSPSPRSAHGPDPGPRPDPDPDSDPGPAPGPTPALHRLASPAAAVLVARRDGRADRLLSREMVLAPARESEGDALAGGGGFGRPSLLRRVSSKDRRAVPSQDGEAAEAVPHGAAESEIHARFEVYLLLGPFQAHGRHGERPFG